MTAVTPSTGPAATRARSGPRAALEDTWLITRRIAIGYKREPVILLFLVVQPVMFVLLFVYVFGGALEAGLPPGVDYVDYLMGGIIAQTVIFGTAGTTVGIAEDQKKGIVDRFRSLPMWHGAVLGGRAIVDVGQAVFTVALMSGIGALLGFRLQQGWFAGLAALLLAVAVGFAFSWIGMFVGLLAKTPEAASSGGLIWMFPLTFLSSAFVPTATMPGWVQAVAQWNPITFMADAIRGLTLGVLPGQPPLADSVTGTLVSVAVITVVFAPLAVRTFRRTSR